MDVAVWFRTWLHQHPLKDPAVDRAHYTAEIMARVRAVHGPAPVASRPWLQIPRIVFASAAVAAGIAVTIGTTQLSHQRLAARVVRDSHLLASLGEVDPELLAGDEISTLTQEAETIDTLQLAETGPSDEQWLKQTLQLLDQVNESPTEVSPVNDSHTPSDENWLNELEMLDEHEFSSSS